MQIGSVFGGCVRALWSCSIPLLVLAVAGCSALPRHEMVGRAAIAPAIEKPDAADVVGVSDDDFIGFSSEDMFVIEPLTIGDTLPDVDIAQFSIANPSASISDFLRVVLTGTKVSYSIDTESSGGNVMRRSFVASNISGKLKDILDTFSNSLGFFWYYKDGVLHVTPESQFVAKLPPIPELFDSLPNVMRAMGAADVYVDRPSRSVIYRANKPSHWKISAYLKHVRDNQQLIVYKMYVAEVALDDKNSTGIQWNKFLWLGSAGTTPVTMSVTGGTSLAGTAGALGAGVAFTGKHFAVDVLSNFLKSQGSISQISKVPMMVLSGGSSEFKNGKTDYYVSSISPSTVVNGQSIPGSSQLTALHTGFNIVLNGDYSNGTIFTKIKMDLSTLDGYTSFPAGAGSTQEGPRTSEQMVNSTVRGLSGGTILLAGINYNKMQSDASGLPGGTNSLALLSGATRQVQRTELVILLEPRYIQFVSDTPKDVSKISQRGEVK